MHTLHFFFYISLFISFKITYSKVYTTVLTFSYNTFLYFFFFFHSLHESEHELPSSPFKLALEKGNSLTKTCQILILSILLVKNNIQKHSNATTVLTKSSITFYILSCNSSATQVIFFFSLPSIFLLFLSNDDRPGLQALSALCWTFNKPATLTPHLISLIIC